MDNKLRLERLTELQGMLTHHEALFKGVCSFDIGSWQRVTTKGCGTAACALGSACLHEPFRKQGLKLDPFNDPFFNGAADFEAGQEFFGLTAGESEFLFGPWAYTNPLDRKARWGSYAVDTCKEFGITKGIRNVKPHHVAERVAMLINKYKEK